MPGAEQVGGAPSGAVKQPRLTPPPARFPGEGEVPGPHSSSPPHNAVPRRLARPLPAPSGPKPSLLPGRELPQLGAPQYVAALWAGPWEQTAALRPRSCLSLPSSSQTGLSCIHCTPGAPQLDRALTYQQSGFHPRVLTALQAESPSSELCSEVTSTTSLSSQGADRAALSLPTTSLLPVPGKQNALISYPQPPHPSHLHPSRG